MKEPPNSRHYNNPNLKISRKWWHKNELILNFIFYNILKITNLLLPNEARINKLIIQIIDYFTNINMHPINFNILFHFYEIFMLDINDHKFVKFLKYSSIYKHLNINNDLTLLIHILVLHIFFFTFIPFE